MGGSRQLMVASPWKASCQGRGAAGVLARRVASVGFRMGWAAGLAWASSPSVTDRVEAQGQAICRWSLDTSLLHCKADGIIVPLL